MTGSDWIACGSLAVSLMAMAVSLYYSHRGFGQTKEALEQNSRAVELQVLEGFLREFKRLDAEFMANGQAPSKEWCYRFFNEAEYLCFIINRRIIRGEYLLEFFGPSVGTWHETFTKFMLPGHEGEPDFCKEFQALARQLLLETSQKKSTSA